MANMVIKNHSELAEARAFDAAQLSLIKKTVAADTTTEEFNMFIEICRRQGLDPFRRQIYALVYNKDKEDKRKVAFITGIDGYRAIAKRSGNYRPDGKEPDIEYSEDKKCPETNPLGIVKASVTVWQYAVDGWYPIVGTAKWDEYAPITEEWDWVDQIGKDGKVIVQTEGYHAGKPLRKKQPTGKKILANANWIKMPCGMIAKCAEAQALRKGWPEEVGGLYSEGEIDRLATESLASDEIEAHEKEMRLRAVNAIDTIPLILVSSEGISFVEIGKVYDTVSELLRGFETADAIEFWKVQNRLGLQEYWGRAKTDALALKQVIENRIAELKGKNNA